MEAIRLEARPAIEKVASEMKIDYREVVRILQDIADAQVNSIFDMKYKEHPQAAYRQAMFLCHDERHERSAPRESGTVSILGRLRGREPAVQALADGAYNLPFRALRQYATDRHESKTRLRHLANSRRVTNPGSQSATQEPEATTGNS
jgi:hypothetical protein